MAESDANRAFHAERRRQMARLVNMHQATARDVEALLKQAEAEIAKIVAGAPSEFEAWRLPRLRQEISATLEEIGEALGNSASSAASSAWDAGIDLVDQPIAAGGVRIAAVLESPDTRQLMAMRSFMVDRMQDVSAEVARKISGELGLVMIGAKNTSQAVDAVGGLVEGGRNRALTIVRTEIGTAYSTAAQERQADAAEILPGLKKQWRRSGKIHSRVTHDLADGQIQDVDKPFLIGNVHMMFPRDPEAPVGERVNCGCVSLPFMEHWHVSQPGRQAYSDEEIKLNPRKRDLADALDQ